MSAGAAAPRSRTIATWLAIVGGALGLHRFYLHGWRDPLGWLHWPPTLIGAYGALRMRELGQDDLLAWVLIPFLGLVIAATMLGAIVYGLTNDEAWRRRHDPDGRAFSSPPLNVLGAVVALAFGATALMSTIAFMGQRYFEYRELQRSPAPASAPVR